MNKFIQQAILESTYNKDNMATCLNQFKDSLLEPCLINVNTWKNQEHNFFNKDGKFRNDLPEIIEGVNKMDADKTCWRILSITLLEGEITLQQVMGMFFEELGEYAEMPYRRARILEVFIEAVIDSKQVKLEQRGKYLHLVSLVQLKDLGQKKYGYVLPSLIKHKIKDNRNVGYLDTNVSAISGGALKQHDGELCLDHLQRLSSIQYKVDNRINDIYQPEFDATRQIKEGGKYETDDEWQERRKQFIQFRDELPTKINVMMEHGNEFYLAHRYDTRLRTYLKAFHFDFIGNKQCRAFVQPTKGALVTGADEYL